MQFKLIGYYQRPGQDRPQPVDFSDLFTTSFMRKYTHYRSFDKFLAGGRFNLTCQKDFEDLPEDRMDAHVRKTTRFRSWQEMIDTATDKYIVHMQQP
jgi:hypothetical protein